MIISLSSVRSIYLRDDLWQRVTKIAEAMERSNSQIIEAMIRERLTQLEAQVNGKGVLPPCPKKEN